MLRKAVIVLAAVAALGTTFLPANAFAAWHGYSFGDHLAQILAC